MTDKELIAKAVAMRTLQKQYFATRDRDVLDKCRKAEREFDKAAAEHLNPQKSLLG